MKWVLKRYMVEQHIDSFSELCRRTGIAKRTLYDRIEEPSTMRIYELNALDAVLHFTDEDMIKLSRGLV